MESLGGEALRLMFAMLLRWVTVDFVKKGETLNFFMAKDELVGFLNEDFAKKLLVLNEVVLVAVAKYGLFVGLSAGPEAWSWDERLTRLDL